MDDYEQDTHLTYYLTKYLENGGNFGEREEYRHYYGDHTNFNETIAFGIVERMASNNYLYYSTRLSNENLILINGVLKLGKLTEVSIINNDLHGERLSIIIEGLMCCDQLTTLNLSGNNLDSLEVEMVMTNLKMCTDLNLSNSLLSHESVIVIRNYIQKIGNLRFLSLANCNINLNDIIELSAGLQNARHLMYLDLSHNTIMNAGCRVLSQMLMHHDYLHDLYLSHTGLNNIEELVKLVYNNHELKLIDISDNYLDDDTYRAIQEAMNYREVNIVVDSSKIDDMQVKQNYNQLRYP